MLEQFEFIKLDGCQISAPKLVVYNVRWINIVSLFGQLRHQLRVNKFNMILEIAFPDDIIDGDDHDIHISHASHINHNIVHICRDICRCLFFCFCFFAGHMVTIGLSAASLFQNLVRCKWTCHNHKCVALFILISYLKLSTIVVFVLVVCCCGCCCFSRFHSAPQSTQDLAQDHWQRICEQNCTRTPWWGGVMI